jgi:filamentous hemagglutinin family protein
MDGRQFRPGVCIMRTTKTAPKRIPSKLATSIRCGVAAVAACFVVSPVFSNPVNPVVVNGTASFNQAGNVLTVTNSNGAIIHWDKFSIKAGETTHFAQTSASSAVLNRVLNDPSAIYGTLSSNGRVWLINPAGIMVGAGGRIDTAGFVASTLKVRNEDFLAGRKLFENTPGAGNVINQGEIRTPSGGSVYLVGSNVGNEGIIHTPAGETILASGATVSLIDSATPGVKVDITGAEGNSTNLGTITAEAGRVGIAGVIVRNSGLINASSVVSDGGRVFLKASRDAYVDGNGRIVTTGTKGGSVEVLGNRVSVIDSAEIDASGANGGGKILIGGDYQGKITDVQNAYVSYLGPNASLKADAKEVGAGGTVIVWADDTTRAYGSISARGGSISGDGGFVETSGKRFLEVTSPPDTSAPLGKGGTWLLDPYNIDISATNNSYTVAGTNPLTYGGSADSTSTVAASSIIAALNAGTDVIVDTTGVGIADAGNISVSTAITKSAGGDATLTLKANNNIVVNASIGITSTNNKLNVVLNADSDASGSGAIVMNGGSGITSNNGDITLGGGADPLLNAAVGNGANSHGIYLNGATLNAGAGNIGLRGNGRSGVDSASGIFISGSTLQTTSGAVTLTGYGGVGVTSDMGVYLTGSSLTSNSGNIVILGVGQGTGGSNHGVGIDGATSATATSGLLKVTGISYGTTNGNDAVFIYNNSSLASTTGNIDVTGIVLTGADYAPGVNIAGDSSILSFGNASISITGRSNSASSLSTAIECRSNMCGGGGTIGGASATGPITITAGNASGLALDLTGLTVQSTGAISLQPFDAAASVGVAGGAGSFNVSTATLSALSSGGFSSTTIGRGDSTGALTFGVGGAGHSFNNSVVLLGGAIHINGALNTTGSATLAAYGGNSATGNIAVTGNNINANGGFKALAGWNGATSYLGSDVIPGKGDISISESMVHSSSNVDLHAGNDITLGHTGTSSAGTWIQSNGMMSVSANNLSLLGGSGGLFDISGSQGPGVMLRGDGGQTIAIESQLRLQAGSANNTTYAGSPQYGSSVSIQSGGNQHISANQIKVYAGATGHDNGAEIQSYGSQSINITGTSGLLDVKGGDGNTGVYGGAGGFNNQARIQHGRSYGGNVYFGTGSQTITIYGGATVSLQGGSGNGSLGYYGGECADALGVALCRGSSNGAMIENLKGAQLVDFSPAAGTLAVTGGTIGDQNWAEISNQSDGTTQEVRGNPVITLTGGSSGGRVEVFGADNFDLSNDAGIYSKGSGLQTITASTLTINGGAGASTIGGAGISNEYGGVAGTLFIQTTGDLTLQGGSSNAASPYAAAAYIANRNNGLVSLQVNGNLNVHGGGGSSAPAIIGTIEGAGNVLITTGGNINLTANSSHVAVGSNSAGYGASVIVNSNNDITLTDSLTRGVRIGSLFDSLNPTSVTLSARNDITVGSASGYGAMIGVSTPTAGTAAVDLYAGAHGYGGDLLLNNSARVKVGAGTVSLRAGQDAAANGGITLMNGSASYGGQIALAAGGDLTLNGDIHSASTGGIKAAAGVNVYGGTLNPSLYGGDAFVSGDLLATADDIHLYARVGASNNAGGSITQYGDSSITGNAVFLKAQGDLNLSGWVTSDSNADIYAFAGVGYDATAACSGGPPCPDPTFSSVNGGNLNLAATSRLSSSGAISLAANLGTAASANGNINLLAGGQVEANGSISFVAGHNVNLHGSVDATGVLAPSELKVYAGADFLHAPSSVGGDITASGALFGNQLVKLVAESSAGSGANGNISQTGGSIQTGTGAIGIIGGGDMSLGGSVAAYGGNLQVQAGLSGYSMMPTQYGGNLSISGNLYSNGSKIDLFAQAGIGTGVKGTFSQTAGSVIYGGNVTLVSAGNATISGAITGTSSVLIDSGWNNSGDSATSYGGNLVFTPTSNIQTGGLLEAYAEAGVLTATGGNVVQAGTMNAGGDILIYGDRDVAIGGSVTAGAGIKVWAGWNDTAHYGGSLSFGTGSHVAAYGGDLEAYAVGALESHGDIIQYGGGLYTSRNLILAADGNVKAYGRVEAGMSLNLYAGINSYAADNDEANYYDPNFTSAYGGNIILGSDSRLIGDHVGLYANEGAFPEGTSGHVLQAGGGEIKVIPGVVSASLNIYAAGKVELNGVATVEAGEPVIVHAGFDNPGDGRQTIADRPVAINSLVTYGSSVSLYATGPIAANIQNASLINADISGNSGGIEINHVGASVPTTISLIDNATTNSAVSFTHRGSSLVLNGGHSFSTVGGDIFVAAPENNLTYYGAGFTGASTLLAANGNLTVASSMFVMGDLGLSAGTVLDVNALVHAGNVTLSAPTVNLVSGNVDVYGGDAILLGSTINIGSGATRVMGANVFFGGGTLNLGGRVQTSGQLEFNLANINGNAGGNFYAISPTSNITGFASGNITLNNASYFSAGDNIDLKLTGASSTLSLLNGSYLVADTNSPARSIFLDFTARESSGLVVSGVGSGLFIGDTSTPATASNGLHVTVKQPAGGGSTTVVNELTRATDDVTKSQTEENSPPPPPATGPTGSTQAPGNLGGTTGAEGTFGSESGGTGSGGTGDQTATAKQTEDASTTKSNTKDDSTKEEKDEKEKKDKKDKKSDDAKDEKKDDKPAQKKVAQCGT